MELKARLGQLIQIKPAHFKGIGTPLLVLAALAMIILPMPAFLLDILFTFNIALALVVLLVAIYSDRPLDFAAFPTVLLVATLLRLALNVASTRVVLLEGAAGAREPSRIMRFLGNMGLACLHISEG